MFKHDQGGHGVQKEEMRLEREQESQELEDQQVISRTFNLTLTETGNYWRDFWQNNRSDLSFKRSLKLLYWKKDS